MLIMLVCVSVVYDYSHCSLVAGPLLLFLDTKVASSRLISLSTVETVVVPNVPFFFFFTYS